MKLATHSLSSPDTKSGSLLESRVHFTQKEVRYVQQKAQSIAEFQLRRIRSNEQDNRGDGTFAAPVVPSLELLSERGILPHHQNLAFHAIGLQLDAFSGGALAHEDLLRPLWLSLMLEGNGLRRMMPDTFGFASRLTATAGIESLEAISRHWISDPWQAYRLGLFGFALELMDQHANLSRAEELRLRVRLATHAWDEKNLLEIHSLADADTRLRISLLSSTIAYATKQAKAVPTDLVGELETWISAALKSGVGTGDEFLFAQVVNAVNLVYLTQGKMEPISTHMTDLLERVTPKIANPSRRAHVEGNAQYQRSILARKKGDRASELSALLTAMELDRGFSTLYCRMAQLFHDQGDTRAESFYEMALALSSFDLPTANDYGCFLSDSGQQPKFDSWANLCRVLFPEQFVVEGQGAS